MKKKVITFKANSNDITKKNINLTHWFDNIYYSDPDGHGNCSLISERNGIYGLIQYIRECDITENNAAKSKDILSNIEDYFYNLSWINKAHLQFVKESGLNYERLLNRRFEIEAKRNEDIYMRDKEREQREIKAKEAKEKQYDDLLTTLKNGQPIDASNFVDLMKYKGFKGHPRTVGTLNKMTGVVGITAATKPKGMSWKTHSSIITLANDFLNNSGEKTNNPFNLNTL